MCPDEAKSIRNRPPHAAGPLYLALLGLEIYSWFPDTAISAIIWPIVGVIWAMSVETGGAEIWLSRWMV